MFAPVSVVAPAHHLIAKQGLLWRARAQPRHANLQSAHGECCVLNVCLVLIAVNQKANKGWRMSRAVVIGYAVLLVGTALWIYGYFVTGNPPLFDWHANTPWSIGDYLPNIESEIGMVLVFVSMVPIYWPPRR